MEAAGGPAFVDLPLPLLAVVLPLHRQKASLAALQAAAAAAAAVSKMLLQQQQMVPLVLPHLLLVGPALAALQPVQAQRPPGCLLPLLPPAPAPQSR